MEDHRWRVDVPGKRLNSPYWSAHVATWYRGRQEAEEYCRQRKLPTATFEQWVRHLVSPEDLHKRAENLRKLRQEKLGRQGRKRRPKKRRRPVRHRFGARTDNGPVALRAFWSMHVEAMNWSGMGHAEYAAALGLSPHALRKWRDRFEDSKVEMDWRSLLHPSARAQLSSAANCVRRRYRLTPQGVDGRSNRRASPTSRSGRSCRRRRSPASAWRRFAAAMASPPAGGLPLGVELARKAPQLATVALVGGTSRSAGNLAALVRPDGMMAIDSNDGRAARKNRSFKIVTAGVAARKTGAFQVSSSCPRNGGNECWRRNFSSESGAHGRHFEARKLTTEHDAAGCFVLWASRNRCLTWKVFCSVDRRARDGFWTKIAIPTCNRRASVKHDE